MLRPFLGGAYRSPLLKILDRLHQNYGTPKHNNSKKDERDPPNETKSRFFYYFNRLYAYAKNTICNKKNSAANDRMIYEQALTRWTRNVSIFTFLLFVVTAVQTCAFITGEQPFVYIDEIKLNEHMLTDGTIVSGDLVPNERVKFSFRLKNSGKNVGIVTSFRSATMLSQQLLTNVFLNPDQGQLGWVAPGENARISHYALNNGRLLTFNETTTEEINSGTGRRLWFIGRIIYRQRSRVLAYLGELSTTFCFLFIPPNITADHHGAMTRCGSDEYERIE